MPSVDDGQTVDAIRRMAGFSRGWVMRLIQNVLSIRVVAKSIQNINLGLRVHSLMSSIRSI